MVKEEGVSFTLAMVYEVILTISSRCGRTDNIRCINWKNCSPNTDS